MAWLEQFLAGEPAGKACCSHEALPELKRQALLAAFPGTVVAVTHDRYFLDNVAGWILELDRGKGIPFEGNYSQWLEAKNKRLQVPSLGGGGYSSLWRARQLTRAPCRPRRSSRAACSGPSRRSWSGCAATPRASRRRARPASGPLTSFSARWGRRKLAARVVLFAALHACLTGNPCSGLGAQPRLQP